MTDRESWLADLAWAPTLADRISREHYLASRERRQAQERADAEDRRLHPENWIDVTEPGLEWLGREYIRRPESEAL